MTAPAPDTASPSSNAPAGTPALAPQRPGGHGPWRLLGRVAIGAAVAAGVWTGVVGHWLPDWLRPRVEAVATEALGTPVRLGELRIHPWSLAVEAGDLAVGPSAQPWFKLQRAETQLSLQSVWRMAPVLRHVRLVQPELLLERQSAERFNITAVIERLSQPSPQPQPDTGPARFAVFNIEIKDGVLRYEDRVLSQSHRIDQFRLDVPFVSSLPADLDVTVQPLLQARIDGSPLKVAGKALPFREGHRSEVTVQWQNVDLAHWLDAAKALMPEGMRPEARAGRLDTDLSIVFEQRKAPALPTLAIRGSAQVSRFDIGLQPAPGLGRIDTGWETLRVEGIDAEPLARRVAIASVALDGLSVRVQPASPSAEPAVASSSSSAPATVAAAPWQWSVAKLHVAARQIDAQTQAEAAWPRLTQLLLDVQGLDARAQAPDARWQLSVQDEHGGQFGAQGTAHPTLQRAELDLSLAQWPVAPWLKPLQRQLALPVVISQGLVGAKAHVSANMRVTEAVPAATAATASPVATAASAASPAALSQAVRLSAGQFTLSDLLADAAAVAGAPGSRRQDRIALKAFTVDGIEAEASLAPTSPGLRRLAIASVTADRLDAALFRDARGLLLGQASGASASPAPTVGKASANAPAKGKTPEPSPVPITLGELRCLACAVQFTDQVVSPAGVFSLKRTDLSVKGLGSRMDQPLAIALQTLAQGQGKVRFKGDVRPQPLSVKGALAVVNLDLRALQPYLDPHLNVALASAAAQAEGRITLADDARLGLSARYQGKLGLSDLRLRDRVNEALFLRWASFSLDGADLSYAKGAIDADLGFIALKDFYGRIIVNPDGRLNLASVVKQADQAGQGDQSITTPQAPVPGASAPTSARAPGGVTVTTTTLPPAPSPSASASAADAPPAPQLRWQGIRLAQGEVDFTDTFIKPNYSARLTRIAGDISGVSSRTPEPATVEVSGAVDDGAPLRISGKLHPLGPKLSTDIAGTAKGIELTRLTPYAARYAGYAIEKGTLSVTVRYKVDGGKLEADNQVFLDQLTFGERVDSPDATKLPVLLAVSLLKNARGEIDVNLPISGSLDDPQFSVGGIIWKVILNLIGKAVTAPFALLTGGSSSELGVVPFQPGATELSTAARERLDALVTKLKDRPALKLEGTGWADPDIDTEGLRQAHVDHLMRRAKAKSTGQEISEVVVEPAERSTWLKAAYKAADIQKPRNLVGLAQSLPDDQMAALLKASAPVGKEALTALADERANAVKAYLADKLDAERVRLTASKVAVEGRADSPSGGASVQFNLR
ncbi:MAG: DUF748 domain-containing protein [Pseudomonadota bacterium]